jgi:hypothetical protein
MEGNQNIQPKSIKVAGIILVNQFGDSVDLSEVFTKLYLQESIHSKFTSGQIQIMDSLNLFRSFRMTGQEYINIEIAQFEGDETVAKEPKIVKNFRLFKAVKEQRVDLATSSYTLHFCDPKLMTGLKKRVSKVYRGSMTSILANVLVDEYDAKRDELDLFVDSEPKNVQFISPNWNINSVIEFCKDNADISDKRVAYKNSFFLFSTLNGGMRFMPLHEMIKLNAPVKFTFKDRSSVDSRELSREEQQVGLNTQIFKYHRPSHFNTLRGVQNGGFASKIKTFNPVNKTVKSTVFDISQHFSETLRDHVSGYPMIKSGPEKLLKGLMIQDEDVSPEVVTLGEEIGLNESHDAVVKYDYLMPHSYDNRKKISDKEVFVSYNADNEENNCLQRQAMLEQLQQNIVVVEVSARSDISVGTVVELEIPAAEVPQDDGMMPKDEKTDDRYLITDMTMEIGNKDQSKLILECVKESFAKPIERVRVDNTPVKGERG